MMKIRVQAEINGRVQGVWYRRFTQQAAQAHGVTGWVKNLINGNVLALFEGDEQAVNAVLNQCRLGPELANVEHIEIATLPYCGEFDHFTIR